MKTIRLAAVALCLFAAGCARTFKVETPDVPDTRTPGTLQCAERIGAHHATTLRMLLWWADLPEPVEIDHGIRMYRLQYWTSRHDGSPALASGLCSIPRKGDLRGVVSYQHGTNTERRMAPSKPTLGEGILGSAVFAGAGYLFVAPDYIGFGVSEETHPYLDATSTANAAVDLLKAARTFAACLEIEWPSSIYLVGVSQGGHATMAAQRALEALDDPNLHVVASAPVVGAFDLAGITFPFALQGGSNSHTLYLAYLVNAYSHVYGHPLDSLIVAPYAQLLPSLFDGDHEGSEIRKALPATPRDLFLKEFLDDYDNGRPTWLLDALAENEVFRWSPKAPIRLYYGECDKDVSPTESPTVAQDLSSRGCNVTAVNVGPYEHDESAFHAVPMVRRWFDELSQGKTN